MENVTPILAPEKPQMLQHLGLLFGRALSGKVEITAIHADKGVHQDPADGSSSRQGRQPVRTRFFDIDDLDAATDFATSVNAEPGWNVYVGAALRRPEVFPGKAADDSDFMRTYVVWADADDGAQLDHARDRYRSLGLTPPFVVVTGRTPSKRAQLWWPLETPIDDIDTLRMTLRGIAVELKTDPKVCTGKQLMRLGGSVSWPKKEDRVLERTEVVEVRSAAREFGLEQLHKACPPADRGVLNTVSPDISIAAGGALGLEEKVMDGREAYAFKLIRAHLREWLGTTGSEPTPDELYRAVAPVYLAKADQVRAGRGPEFLKGKVSEALRAFRAGQIPGMRDLDEAAVSWASRPSKDLEAAPEGDDQFSDSEDPLPAGPFRASELSGEPPERQWIVTDWIVEGAVNSLYGDGGLGKTLLAQQLACSVALGVPWLGLPTKQASVLAILCEDDKGELWRRHNAIKAAMGYPVGNPFENVWLWPRVGEDNILVRWDRDGKAILGAFGETVLAYVEATNASLLIFDTLTDFYGGNEIAREQVNYFVKTVLGGLIKRRAAAGHSLTVLLLGHPSVAGKATGSGFSGSTAWNNAVRSRVYLTRPEDGSSDERILTRGKANYAASGDETAVRLFYADGVLHAQEDAEDGNSLLWAAMREVVEKVAQRWRTGSPYISKKGPRCIYGALQADLERGGFKQNIARQAIRECIEEQKIGHSKSNGKSGFKAFGID